MVNDRIPRHDPTPCDWNSVFFVPILYRTKTKNRTKGEHLADVEQHIGVGISAHLVSEGVHALDLAALDVDLHDGVVFLSGRRSSRISTMPDKGIHTRVLRLAMNRRKRPSASSLLLMSYYEHGLLRSRRSGSRNDLQSVGVPTIIGWAYRRCCAVCTHNRRAHT